MNNGLLNLIGTECLLTCLDEMVVISLLLVIEWSNWVIRWLVLVDVLMTSCTDTGEFML